MLFRSFRYAQVRLVPARLTHCMRWLGAARRAHDIAVAYANQRTAFGSRLIDHQGVGFALADNELDLHSARLTGMHESAAVKRQLVRKAKLEVDEAEDKLRNVRKWNQRFGGQADTLLKMLGPLREIVEHTLPDGIAFLVQAQRTLEAYTEVQVSSSEPATTTGEAKPAASEEPKTNP